MQLGSKEPRQHNIVLIT